MNRIKTAAAAAACLAASGAGAQTTSVTLYGIVDIGVEHVRHASPAGGSVTRMPSLTSSVPSRWGLRGREDLGGGLQAEFVLESGFAPDAGTAGQGGRIFGRQAWVGLHGGFGQVSLGRQYTMLGASIADADVFGPGIYGHASFDSYLPNARADNAVLWRGRFGGFTVGAHNSFGRDTVNAGSASGTNCAGERPDDSRACRGWSALLKYGDQRFGAALAVDRIHGGEGALAGLVSPQLTDTRTVLSAHAMLLGARIVGYVLQRNNEGGGATPRTRLYHAGASVPAGPWTIDAGAFRFDQRENGNDATMLALRTTYNFSKRTAAYVQAAHMANEDRAAKAVSVGGAAPAPGVDQTGVSTGLRLTF